MFTQNCKVKQMFWVVTTYSILINRDAVQTATGTNRTIFLQLSGMSLARPVWPDRAIFKTNGGNFKYKRRANIWRLLKYFEKITCCGNFLKKCDTFNSIVYQSHYLRRPLSAKSSRLQTHWVRASTKFWLVIIFSTFCWRGGTVFGFGLHLDINCHPLQIVK